MQASYPDRALTQAAPHPVFKWRGVPWVDKAAALSSVAVRGKKSSFYQRGRSASADNRFAKETAAFRVPQKARFAGHEMQNETIPQQNRR